MIGIVERLLFDAVRCETQFSKGVARNITEAAGVIEGLTKERDEAFERGKDIGKMIGWQQAKDDTSAMLAANFPPKA